MVKDTDIIEFMETPISEIQFETKDMTIRTTGALRKTYRDFNVCCAVYLGSTGLKKIKNLGKKCFQALKEKLMAYGIDIENEYQCQYLIQEYIKKQNKRRKSVTALLNKQLKDECSVFTYETLNLNGYQTIYDVISEDKDMIKDILKKKGFDYIDRYYTEIRLLLIKNGIDINDNKQCTKLLEKYEYEKAQKELKKKQEQKEIEVSEKEEQLDIITRSNETLEKYIIRKHEILEELKKQKIKRYMLEKQMAECDEEYVKLLEEYNSLNMEYSKTYGLK